MKKLYYLIILALILGLVLTGCSLLSNVGQVPATEQSGISYLTKSPFPGLVGLWHFDGDALDSSGNFNHGSLMGDASWTSGKFGNALSFDGYDDGIYVADSSSLDFSTAITIEAWIYLHSNTNDHGHSIQTVAEKNLAYYLNIQSGKLSFYWYGLSAPGYHKSPNTLPLNTWIHVAATYNGSYVKLYENGVNVYSTSVTGTGQTSNWHLGIGYEPYKPVIYPRYFDGLIDEVRIWNVALSEGELGKVYDFDGFYRPIDNNVLNIVKAGRAIPVKFSLDGDKGLDIFAMGYPKSKVISCELTSLIIEDEETMTAGDSSLNYDADDDQYIYVWKTDKAWAGDCRQLEVKLNDGQSYCASFEFK